MKNILDQTYRDYEVILVDNLSVDNTAQTTRDIIFSFEEAREKFTVLSCDKMGPSAARNVGIRSASGQYIMFLDADDIQSPNMFETMVEAMDDSDNLMATCGYETWYDGQLAYESPEESGVLAIEEMVTRLFQVEHYQGFVWNKIFRLDLIQDNKIFFNEEFFYNEDRLFITEYLCNAYVNKYEATCKMLPNRLYTYILRQQSAMGQSREGQAVTDKTATEIGSFNRIEKLVKKAFTKESQAYKTMAGDYVFSIFRIYKKMYGPEDGFHYKKCKLRKYARQACRFDTSFLRERDQILFKLFIRYGFTGSCYTKNPEFFEEEC